jgi:DNA-binding SARP family transcriptional activator/DNA-binding XRE family transcriptional regulator
MSRGDCGPAGSLCRRYRQEAGLTQRQLADAAGVSIGVVRDLEQGLTVRPRAYSARRLAAALCLDRSRARDFAWAVRGGPGGRPLPFMTGAARVTGLRLSILGPLAAWRDGLPVALGGGSQRVVLGLLALHPNRPMHRETIIDALWGDDPPATAVAMIQCCVSRLRRLLDPDRAGGGGGRLTRTGASYRLCLGAAELDQLAFTGLADGARRAAESGAAARACGMYAEALDLWRGEPLADVDPLRAHPAVINLSQQRADVLLRYAEAALAVGRYDRVLPRLRELAHREPLNERAQAHLIVTLAVAGQQAVALRVYDEVRGRLAEQLGVSPGVELSRAYERVLHQEFPAVPPGLARAGK